jgi:hypothetical protein
VAGVGRATLDTVHFAADGIRAPAISISDLRPEHWPEAGSDLLLTTNH